MTVNLWAPAHCGRPMDFVGDATLEGFVVDNGLDVGEPDGDYIDVHDRNGRWIMSWSPWFRFEEGPSFEELHRRVQRGVENETKYRVIS